MPSSDMRLLSLILRVPMPSYHMLLLTLLVRECKVCADEFPRIPPFVVFFTIGLDGTIYICILLSLLLLLLLLLLLPLLLLMPMGNTARELVSWLSDTTNGFDVLTHRVHETEVKEDHALPLRVYVLSCTWQ